MGTAIGLMLGLGLFCVYWSCWPRETRAKGESPWLLALADDLAQAGLDSVAPSRLLLACAGAGTTVALLVLAVTAVAPVAMAFGLFAAYAPIAFVRARARKRRTSLRDIWPDVVDNVASAVRAGLALPEALAQVGYRGPVELRPAFAAFAEDYRATGKYSLCLDRLKERLADPVADRLIESLRLARDVGGSDLGRLLRTLSAFLREDARTRAELEARQSWTVNAARLAVAAPWVVLAMLATKPDSIRAYARPQGVVVLILGAVVSLAAYRIMARIGRLPEDQRVLR